MEIPGVILSIRSANPTADCHKLHLQREERFRNVSGTCKAVCEGGERRGKGVEEAKEQDVLGQS